MRHHLAAIVSALVPTRCPVCESVAEGVCGRCSWRLTPSPLLPTPTGLVSCRAAFAYNEVARSVVLAVKRRRCHALTSWMAEAMLPHIAVADAGWTGNAIDVVTWPPTEPQRIQARGFDHAELLARSVARRLGVRSVPLLMRTSEASSGAGRRQRAMVSFEACGLASRKAFTNILLIDDVRTTGATLHAAARALGGCVQGRSMPGASPRSVEIVACTFASTPVQRVGTAIRPLTFDESPSACL